MPDTQNTMLSFIRIGLVGDIGSKDVGPRAILEGNLLRIRRLFGTNCAVYIFSDDVTTTALDLQGTQDICLDCLHRLSDDAEGDPQHVVQIADDLCGSDPSPELARRYATLLDIISQLDVLCLIGGDYLATGSHTLLAELYAATQLARHYGVKITATGLTLPNASSSHYQLATDILAACDVIDLCDSSDEAHITESLGSAEVLSSADDSVGLRPRPAGILCTEARHKLIASQEGNYLNVSLPSTASVNTQGVESLLSYVSTLATSDELNHVNVLAFRVDEVRYLEQTEALPEGVRLIDLTEAPLSSTYSIIAKAQVNICGNLHHLLFSAQSKFPAITLIKDGDKGACLYTTSKRLSVAMCPWSEFIAETKTLADLNQMTTIPSAESLLQLCTAKDKVFSKVYVTQSTPEDLLRTQLDAKEPIKVSVIIPIYNMERYLSKCLESVLSQSLREIEVICVDDGSTDDSSALLAEAAWNDRRIRVISQTNQGVSAARNAGLAAARGEYVFFIDPDDWLASTQALSALYNAAVTHGMRAACGSFLQSAQGGTAPLYSNWRGRSYGYTITENGPLTYRDFQFDFGYHRFIYHREALVENNLWFPNRIYYEDPVWFVRVMDTIGTFWTVPLPVYCYRAGHKAPELNYDQTVDYFSGAADILAFAREHDYERLWSLTYGRLTHQYPPVIAAHLAESDLGPRLGAALAHLNEVCEQTGGAGHVELDIIANAAAVSRKQDQQESQQLIDQLKKNHKREIDDLKRRIEEERQLGKQAVAKKEREIRSSKTWRIGNFFMWLPKRIKHRLLKR